MTPKQRAEEAAEEFWYLDRKTETILITIIEAALLAQQAEHEAELSQMVTVTEHRRIDTLWVQCQLELKEVKAERDAAVEALAAWKAAAVDDSDAAVAEALERVAKALAEEPHGYWWAEKVRALKPRGDLTAPYVISKTEHDALQKALMRSVTIIDGKPRSDMVCVPNGRIETLERALETIRDECFSGNAYDIAVRALNDGNI